MHCGIFVDRKDEMWGGAAWRDTRTWTTVGWRGRCSSLMMWTLIPLRLIRCWHCSAHCIGLAQCSWRHSDHDLILRIFIKLLIVNCSIHRLGLTSLGKLPRLTEGTLLRAKIWCGTVCARVKVNFWLADQWVTGNSGRWHMTKVLCPSFTRNLGGEHGVMCHPLSNFCIGCAQHLDICTLCINEKKQSTLFSS